MWGQVRTRRQFELARPNVFLTSEDGEIAGERPSAADFEITSKWGFYRPRDISLQHIKLIGQPSSFVLSLATASVAQGFLVICFIFLYKQFPLDETLIRISSFGEPAGVGSLIFGVSFIFAGLQWWRAGMVGGTAFFRSYNVVSEVWLGMGRLQFGCNERGISIENNSNVSYFVQWPKIDYIYDSRGGHKAVFEKFLTETLNAISIGERDDLRSLAEEEIRRSLFHATSVMSFVGVKNNIRMRLKTKYRTGTGDANLVTTFDKRKKKGWRRFKEISRDVLGQNRRKARGGQRIIFEDYLAIPKHFFEKNEMCSWQEFLFFCFTCKLKQLVSDEPYRFRNYIQLLENEL